MSRQPTKNPPQDGDRIRISFILDKRLEPELAYLFDLQGHGDRPRELVRLAVLGHRAEVEAKRIAQAARWGGLANLSQYLGAEEAGMPPAAPMPEPSPVATPKSGATPVKPNAAPKPEAPPQKEVAETELAPEVVASEPQNGPEPTAPVDEDATPEPQSSAPVSTPPKEGPGPNLDFLS